VEVGLDPKTILETAVLGLFAIMGTDYVNFRLSPPYVSKVDCGECKAASDKLEENRDKHLRDLLDRVDLRMDRIEASVESRMDRIEGLLLSLVERRSDGPHSQ
jgi:hypothetical protein